MSMRLCRVLPKPCTQQVGGLSAELTSADALRSAALNLIMSEPKCSMGDDMLQMGWNATRPSQQVNQCQILCTWAGAAADLSSEGTYGRTCYGHETVNTK